MIQSLLSKDSRLNNPYAFGGSDFPYYNFLSNLNGPGFSITASQYENIQNHFYVKTQPVFSGLIFKWAYQNPFLHEMIVPFQVNHMEKIPDIILYIWLRHANNIFCLGYDDKSNWHDRSSEFKRNLILEKAKRNIHVNDYDKMSNTLIKGKTIQSIKLPVSDYQSCQYTCDQNKHCKAFTYINGSGQGQALHYCLFYDSESQGIKSPCAFCTVFTKRT